MINQRSVDAGDVTLAVAEAGLGGRPLVFVHGFTGAKEDFTHLLEPCANAGWHAVAYDHRGHGASSKPDPAEAYSIELLVDDLFALMDTLGWERATALGHSMGGMVVQCAAIAQPERFRALVLMDTHHRGIDVPYALFEIAANIIRTEGPHAFVEKARAMGLFPGAIPEGSAVSGDAAYAEFAEAKVAATAPGVFEGLGRQISDREDTLERLGTLRIPCLSIAGELDVPFVGAAAAIAGAMPAAELAVVPGAGHCPQFEQPDAYWRAVSGFLERVA